MMRYKTDCFLRSFGMTSSASWNLRLQCTQHPAIFRSPKYDVPQLRLFRHKAVTSGYGIWKLFPSFFAEFCRQFPFRHVMVDALHRNTGQILILFPCLFFLFGCSYLQLIRFGCGQVTDSTICSIISCILSLRVCVCFVSSSIWS